MKLILYITCFCILLSHVDTQCPASPFGSATGNFTCSNPAEGQLLVTGDVTLVGAQFPVGSTNITIDGKLSLTNTTIRYDVHVPAEGGVMTSGVLRFRNNDVVWVRNDLFMRFEFEVNARGVYRSDLLESTDNENLPNRPFFTLDQGRADRGCQTGQSNPGLETNVLTTVIRVNATGCDFIEKKRSWLLPLIIVEGVLGKV